MRKFCLLFVMFVFSLHSFGYEYVTVGDFGFLLTDTENHTATLVGNYPEYSGDVIIPATFYY